MRKTSQLGQIRSNKNGPFKNYIYWAQSIEYPDEIYQKVFQKAQGHSHLCYTGHLFQMCSFFPNKRLRIYEKKKETPDNELKR